MTMQELWRNSIYDFYEANRDKEKAFVVQSFKNLITNKILSQRILKKYEDHGNTTKAFPL